METNNAFAQATEPQKRAIEKVLSATDDQCMKVLTELEKEESK